MDKVPMYPNTKFQFILLLFLVTSADNIWCNDNLPSDLVDGHCDSDKSNSDKSKSDKCPTPVQRPSCLKYNAEIFKTSPSMFTYFPMGRLGNTISAYLVRYQFFLWFTLHDIDHLICMIMLSQSFKFSNFYKLTQRFRVTGLFAG